MPVLRGIGCLATCAAGAGASASPGARPAAGPGATPGLVRDAALAWEDGVVSWAGPEADLPADAASGPRADAGGRLVVPGLVDCHTHLAFGGWRADEFRRRLQGESYAEIARSGGGILSTVRATRRASEDELAERCRGFLREMAALGVTTVEAKSGYGLSLEEEKKLLRVYRRLGAEEGLPRIVPTFLGAHALPPERADAREAFVEEVAEEWIPAVAEAGLARFCDVFVEEEAFTVEEGRRVLEAGKSHGLSPKLHADQLTDGGGAALAAAVGAVSADHLDHVSPEGIAALSEAGVVAVLLPLAGLQLGQDPAPGRALVDAGARVAVATDFNPGTAPSYHLPLAMTLACLRAGLTPGEALVGATCHAARAAGMEDRVGALEPGKAADFAVVDAPDPDHWLYHFRPNACVATVARGRVLWQAHGVELFDGGEAHGAAPGGPAGGMSDAGRAPDAAGRDQGEGPARPPAGPGGGDA